VDDVTGRYVDSLLRAAARRVAADWVTDALRAATARLRIAEESSLSDPSLQAGSLSQGELSTVMSSVLAAGDAASVRQRSLALQLRDMAMLALRSARSGTVFFFQLGASIC
jgi:hypothetical protein